MILLNRPWFALLILLVVLLYGLLQGFMANLPPFVGGVRW
jgi:hypothetical protein